MRSRSTHFIPSIALVTVRVVFCVAVLTFSSAFLLALGHFHDRSDHVTRVSRKSSFARVGTDPYDHALASASYQDLSAHFATWNNKHYISRARNYKVFNTFRSDKACSGRVKGWT